jgi:chromosome partitioning protein
MILAVLNHKGGVGKTTTAVNTAAALADRGLRTLLVDLDSQGSAGLSLGVNGDDGSPSAADMILDEAPARSVIRSTSIEGLDIIPGAVALAETDVALYDAPHRAYRLRTALEPIRDEYNHVLLDCPPSLGLLTLNALLGSDAYLVPIIPQYLAVEGLLKLTAAVARLSEGTGEELTMFGLVLTMVDYRNRVTRDVIEQIRGYYGKQVFATEIRVNVRLSEAPSFGQSIFQYDPTSTGAAAYKELAGEFIKRSKAIRKEGNK